MGNKEIKYSIVGEKNAEIIGEIINGTDSSNNIKHLKNYDMKTVINIIMSKKISIIHDDIMKSIENYFIHRSELKIIYDNLIQRNNFDYVFPENLIMFRLDIKGLIIVVVKINNGHELQEYTIDTQNYNNNKIFVTHLIPLLPYEI